MQRVKPIILKPKNVKQKQQKKESEINRDLIESESYSDSESEINFPLKRSLAVSNLNDNSVNLEGGQRFIITGYKNIWGYHSFTD